MNEDRPNHARSLADPIHDAAMQAWLMDIGATLPVRGAESGGTATAVAPAPDPWAHRRGEPRLFAFFWTLYVLLAVAGSLTWVARYTTITASSYGPSARLMLIVVTVGMLVLWPMTRLSQASPRGHPALSTLADCLVVQFPIQVVIWPLVVLAGWPPDIVVGLSAMLATWGVVTGGFLALALCGRPISDPASGGVWERSAWMVGSLAVGFGALVLQAMLLRAGLGVPAWATMASPVTGIAALTGRGLAGPSAPVSRVQWETIGVTLSVGILLWAAAVARHGLASRARMA